MASVDDASGVDDHAADLVEDRVRKRSGGVERMTVEGFAATVVDVERVGRSATNVADYSRHVERSAPSIAEGPNQKLRGDRRGLKYFPDRRLVRRMRRRLRCWRTPEGVCLSGPAK